MAETRSKCPYCGEQILAEAAKCRFCHEWLKNPSPLSPTRKGSSSARAVSKGIKEKEFSDFGVKVRFYILLVILFGITFLVLSIYVKIFGQYGPTGLDSHQADVILTWTIVPIWIIGLIIGAIKLGKYYYEE